MLVINVVARFSRTFSDFYVEQIFPRISTIHSHFSGLFPFSVGEVMIILGILLVVIGIPLFLILLIVKKGFTQKNRRCISLHFPLGTVLCVVNGNP